MHTLAKLGLTTGLLVGSQIAAPPADSQIANPECLAIVDDTLGELGKPSAELQQVMGAYATLGLEVHVQVFADGRPRGISETGDAGQKQADQYAKGLAETCHWDGRGVVNVTVTKDPRTWNVYKSGAADEAISTEQGKEAGEGFIAALRDENTSYQDDIAGLLKNIQPGHVKSQAELDREHQTRVELWVLGGFAAAVIIGGGIWAYRKGYFDNMDSGSSGSSGGGVFFGSSGGDSGSSFGGGY